MMNRLKRVVKRILRPEQKPKFPQDITVSDLVKTPLKFRAYSPVERYRVTSYGAERHALDTFLAQIQPTDVVYDVGASVGLYTLSLAAKTPQGQVIAFEPDPDTRERLTENVHLNVFKHIVIVDWAASDKAGSTVLYTDGAKGNAPSMARKSLDRGLKSEVSIATNSIDNAIIEKTLAVPDVIKIDIEGAEGLCIKGAHQLLSGQFSKKPRIILIEIHPDFMEMFGMSADQLEADLAAYGYTILWQENREAQKHILYHLN